MAPKTQIDDWNQPDTCNVNNCYNYATDHLNKAEKGSGGAPTEKVHPATPGATHDLDPYKFRYDPVAETVKLEITCESLKAACVKLDDLKEEEHCQSHSECWRIAYYIKEDEHNWRNRVTWDGFHFAREDQKAGPGGNPSAKWSHKPGIGCKATDKRYNPATKRYDGPPITDPTDPANFEPGYKFCGYLCVCPGTKVAYHKPSTLFPPGESKVAMYAYKNFSSISAVPVMLDLRKFDTFTKSLFSTPENLWLDGFGPGRTHYRFDLIDEKSNVVQTFFVSEQSVTVWDEEVRHILDPEGRYLRQLSEMSEINKEK